MQFAVAAGCNNFLGSDEQGLDLERLDPSLLGNQLAEEHQRRLQRRERREAEFLQDGPIIRALFQYTAGQGRIQRRQPDDQVAISARTAVSRPKQQDWPELLV